jgi:hypothetical protein
MHVYDPGHFAWKRSYRFLPYHWRRFRGWWYSIGPTVGAFLIMGALVFVAVVLLIANALAPSLGLVDEAATQRLKTGTIGLAIGCGIIAFCYAAAQLFFRRHA